jgi:hypothetical protein
MSKKIISIDIGLLNLAFVYATYSEDYSLVEVSDIKKIDLTQYANCSVLKCDLNHSKCISNYMKHLFKEYKIFKESNVILVERQPLNGFVSIEQIIQYEYSDKTILISPNSMHAHFEIGHLDYDHRKEMTVKLASSYLDKFEEYNILRKHDIADAMCILLYYLNINHAKFVAEQQLIEHNKIIGPYVLDLKQFMYIEDS